MGRAPSGYSLLSATEQRSSQQHAGATPMMQRLREESLSLRRTLAVVIAWFDVVE